MLNHACNYITVDYQQIVYSNIANQIPRFTIDYGALLGLSVFNCHMKLCHTGVLKYRLERCGTHSTNKCLLFSRSVLYSLSKVM